MTSKETNLPPEPPPLTAFVCPYCAHRVESEISRADVGHDCPKNLTPRGRPRWTRYQPQPEGDTAA